LEDRWEVIRLPLPPLWNWLNGSNDTGGHVSQRLRGAILIEEKVRKVSRCDLQLLVSSSQFSVFRS